MLEEEDEIELMDSSNIPETSKYLQTSRKRPKGPSLVIFNQKNKIQKLEEEIIELLEENKHLQEENSKDKQCIQQLEHTIGDEDLIIAQLKAEFIKLRQSASATTTCQLPLEAAKKLAYSLGMQAGQG